MKNSLNALAESLFSALYTDLPEIEYTYQSPRDKMADLDPEIRTRRPQEHDCEIMMFPQTWPSTALGFGGIGGDAMTQAYTVIVVCGEVAAIYFGGIFAYLADNWFPEFHDDVKLQRMKSVKDSHVYRKDK